MNHQKSSLVELSPIREDELFLMYRWRNSPDVYKWCRQYEPVTYEHHVKHWAKVARDRTIKMYGLRCVEPIPRLVGVCGLTSIDYINSRAEFSLYIAPEQQGKGYGFSGLKKLCQHGFDVLNLHSIWGESFEGNPAISMFKKLGFKEDGIRRSFYYRNGFYVDCILFSVLRGELCS